MKIRFAALVAAIACVVSACASAQPRKGPKLIVAISVDQLSTDLFNEYRGHFTGGLKRLAGGVAFANGYQAHGATETCPGHSTILTGSHPARTGVIANNWMDFAAAREDKNVYCGEDESVPGSNSRSYTVSDVHLRVPALGDRLKAADPASRVVSVAGKDRSALMMGGHAPDQRWWWSGGKFIQNSSPNPAPVAEQVNQAVAKAIAERREPLVPPTFCAPKDKPYDLGSGGIVGTHRFQRAAGDAQAFAGGPEYDAAVLALAAGMIQQMNLGKGNATDLIAIGLSATDHVGHRYGPGGLEMCLQLMSLDSDLDGFFTLLDRSGIDYAVVLTSDHGGLELTERARAMGDGDAARLDPAATPDAIGAEIGKRLGLTGKLFAGDWYLTPDVPAPRRAEVVALARSLLAAHPQVDSSYSAVEVAAHPMPTGKAETWSVLDRVRASYDPKRSGDLLVVYKPNVMPITTPFPGYAATHGSVWDYDRKVPILFWWPGVAEQDRSESAMTVDILPTLASLVGLNVPAGEIDGRCLDLVEGEGSNCK